MQYHHFSIEEREKIQDGLWRKQSIRSIAKELNRSPPSVSREIKKNLPQSQFRAIPNWLKPLVIDELLFFELTEG
jgi:IS30 family transposase